MASVKKPGKGGNRKEQDPDLQMKMKFKAKCRFRAIYRLVLANLYWLIEDVEQYEGVDDVKRRVQQAVRGKAKTKQLLTIRDKALLNKNAEDRTDQEKKYLYRILGGLKCFKQYPNNVKRKLAAVTYFKYFGPGRVIVRQQQEAHAMYFIVTGDVVVSQLVWDGLLQEYVSNEICVMHHGEMFGEVSLLHNIKRIATVTTASHCELLALLKEDFKNILQSSVQKQWDEVLNAMNAFTYFDSLDEIGRREGCIVGKIKSYKSNETILGDGVGVPNFVYFVLTGRCQMIESMQMIVTKRLGKTYFTLYDPYVPKPQSEQDLDKKYFRDMKTISDSATTKEESNSKGILKAESAKTQSILKHNDTTSSTKHTKISIINESKSGINIEEKDKKKRLSASSGRGDRVSINSQVILPPSDTQYMRESFRITIPLKGASKPANLKTFFMQVAQFNPGSTFGFGENMKDRRIVALTPVSCLLLPSFWLLQRNTANIWTRIKHFLEKKIPDKKELFQVFVNERHWQEYRDLIVNDVVRASNTVNSTTVHDVPYSIRLEEMYDA